jgi:xylulose-5-phosphate/fructose-6-phosphate phosphoketolase
MASAGDIPTLETMAAIKWLHERAPELNIRMVNVVDLMTLFPRERHPHGMREEQFRELFTDEGEVVFAFHGYAGAVHNLVHGRPRPERFHVRGFQEEGTTTTPFDMVVLNEISRYHLAIEALRRARRAPANAQALIAECYAALDRHHGYIREHLEDLPEIRNWTWT